MAHNSINHCKNKAFYVFLPKKIRRLSGISKNDEPGVDGWVNHPEARPVTVDQSLLSGKLTSAMRSGLFPTSSARLIFDT